MATSKLPVEILHRVLDFILWDLDAKTTVLMSDSDTNWDSYRKECVQEKRVVGMLSLCCRSAWMQCRPGIFRAIILDSSIDLNRLVLFAASNPEIALYIQRIFALESRSKPWSCHLSLVLPHILPHLSTLQVYQPSIGDERPVDWIDFHLFAPFIRGCYASFRELRQLVLTGCTFLRFRGLQDLLATLPMITHLGCYGVSWKLAGASISKPGAPVSKVGCGACRMQFVDVRGIQPAGHGIMVFTLLPQIKRRYQSHSLGIRPPVEWADIEAIARLVDCFMLGTEKDVTKYPHAHSQFTLEEQDGRWLLSVYTGLDKSADRSRVLFKFSPNWNPVDTEVMVEGIEWFIYRDWQKPEDKQPDLDFDWETIGETLAKFEALHRLEIHVDSDLLPNEFSQIVASYITTIISSMPLPPNCETVVTSSIPTPLSLQPLSSSNKPAFRSPEILSPEYVSEIIQDALAKKGNGEQYLFSLRGAHAERALFTLQEMLDKTRSKDGIIDPHILCGYYRLLRKLSVQSTTLPSFLFLFGISCTGDDRLDPRGVGGFSDIFYGTYGGTPVALKRLRFPTRDRYTRKYHIAVCREALIWRQLHHQNIQPFLGVDLHTFRGYACMVSPWLAYGSIHSCARVLMDRGEDPPLDRWLEEIASGLKYLHAQSLYHGDLRGPNILIDDDLNVRLTDFGVTSFATAATESTATHGTLGNVRWTAPELLEDDECRRDEAADIYSYACVCVEVYTGQPPFYKIKNNNVVVSKVLRYQLRPDRPSRETGMPMSDTLWALVQRCWDQEPKERPEATTIVKIIRGLRKISRPRSKGQSIQ